MQTQDAEGFSALALGQGQERPGDDKLLVKFYMHPRENAARTAEEGRPIMDEVEYISIMVPGQKDSVVQRPVSDIERKRFPRHYQAFKERKEMPVDGTPLSSWPGITRGQVEELRFFNVNTVEQLAEVADNHAQKFMGIAKLRSRAKLFLESAGNSAATSKLAAELESRDNEIAALKEALADQGKQIQELMSGAVSNSDGDDKPGRRRSRANASK